MVSLFPRYLVRQESRDQAHFYLVEGLAAVQRVFRGCNRLSLFLYTQRTLSTLHRLTGGARVRHKLVRNSQGTDSDKTLFIK
jgi:hypothetical protein